MNILFICNQNQNRSKTAQEIFQNQFKTKSAGLYATKPVTPKDISWADTVCVMEDIHRAELARRFPALYLQKRIISLNIPDVYHHNHPQLIALLKSRVKELL